MLSARIDPSARPLPVLLESIDDPPLPGPGWARVEVRAGGICGTDLHTLRPDGSESAIFRPYVGVPPRLGHEMSGVVVEAGPDCPVAVGTAVAVDPVLGCASRGVDPCTNCRAGAESACLNLRAGTLPWRGFGHGFATGLGGGWSERLLAHTSQLHPVPAGVPVADAVLAEPLSVSLHGLLRRPPVDGVPALVIGAGIIGLTAVVALRALVPSSPVVVVARHPHQAAAARRLGATEVLPDGELEALAVPVGAEITGRGDGALLVGGYGAVVEAVGTAETLSLALRTCAQRGVVHLLGAVQRTSVDLAPLWFKELDVVGAFCHASDGGRHTFDRALELLAAGALPADLVVTHRFPLPDLQQALATAADRAAGAIKVVLEPAGYTAS